MTTHTVIKTISPEIAARIDWRAGEDRGRIWRIVPEQHSADVQPFQSPESSKNKGVKYRFRYSDDFRGRPLARIVDSSPSRLTVAVVQWLFIRPGAHFG